jgi:hypothetical protein
MISRQIGEGSSIRTGINDALKAFFKDAAKLHPERLHAHPEIQVNAKRLRVIPKSKPPASADIPFESTEG